MAATWGRPKHTEASTPACQEAQALSKSAAVRSLTQALACLGPRPEPAHLTRMRCPWACRSSMAIDRAPVQSAMLGEATASAVRQSGGAADELVRVGERRAVRCGMHQSTSHTAGARTRRTVSCTCQQIGGRGSRGVRRQRQRRQRAWADGRGLGRPQAQQTTAGPPSLRAPAASCLYLPPTVGRKLTAPFPQN